MHLGCFVAEGPSWLVLSVPVQRHRLWLAVVECTVGHQQSCCQVADCLPGMIIILILPDISFDGLQADTPRTERCNIGCTYSRVGTAVKFG